MQKVYHIRQCVRFRGWSRKGYAVFISLGRLVTIGCLDKGVTDVALKKQKGGTMQISARQPETEEASLEEDSRGWTEVLADLLPGLSPRLTADAACGGAERIKLINNDVQRGHMGGVVRQPVRVPSFFMHGKTGRYEFDGN